MAMAMIVLLVASCSGDILEDMHRMGSNIYGFHADTTKIEQAEKSLDESVSYGEEDVEINWDGASEAAKTGADVASGSNQLEKVIRDKMSEKVTTDTVQAEHVSRAMKDKLDDIGSSAETSEGNPSSNTIMETVAAIKESVGSEPTRADLVTVAIVGSLADDSVLLASSDKGSEDYYKTANKVASNSLKAINTLKMIGSASSFEEMLSNIDFASFVPSSRKGKLMDVVVKATGLDKEEVDEIASRVSASVRPILENIKGLMEVDGSYSEDAYLKIVRDMYALRLAYEVYASALNPVEFESLEDCVGNAVGIVKGEIGYIGQDDARDNSNFTFDDIVYYCLSLVLTEKTGVYEKLCDYLDGNMSAEDSLMSIASLEGVTEAEERSAYNTGAILADATGWAETINKLCGENLTSEAVLEQMDKLRTR